MLEGCDNSPASGARHPASPDATLVAINLIGPDDAAELGSVPCADQAQVPRGSGGNDTLSLAAALSLAGTGDRLAFAQVYQRTSAKLFGICLCILGSRSEAEEALQDAYIKVWQNAAVFDPARSSPITWLVALSRNTAIDRLRARASRPCGSLDVEALAIVDPATSASAMLEDAEQWQHIACWIDQLEDKQAAAIRGAFFEGSTYAELALHQGVPLATMKSWVRRGLAALKHAGTTMADDSDRPATFNDVIGNAVTRIEGY